MSYTELYKFVKLGFAHDLGEFKNSWRGAVAIVL